MFATWVASKIRLLVLLTPSKHCLSGGIEDGSLAGGGAVPTIQEIQYLGSLLRTTPALETNFWIGVERFWNCLQSEVLGDYKDT